MKTKLLIAILLLAGLTAGGQETLYVAGYSLNYIGILYIEAVKQVGSEIHVTTRVSEQGVYGAVAPLIATTIIRGPVLLARTVSSTFLPPGTQPPVLDNELATVHFDFNAGDGWADTNALGWVYTRYYPWVWSPPVGWLYVIPGVLTSPLDGFEPVGIFPSYDVKLRDKNQLPLFTDDNQLYLGMSYWLWSPDKGWMIKSELSNWFYVFEQKEWRLADSLW